ncbi:MAG: hypothetical protein K2L06_03110, partial [Alistipes sp.]|nr:hypothetical protein [Alistipes sp.]
TELHRQNQPFWIAKVGIFFLSRKLFRDIFSTFSSFSKNRVRNALVGSETGCKDRNFFEYRNRLCEKYHLPEQRLPFCPAIPFRTLYIRPQNLAISARSIIFAT